MKHMIPLMCAFLAASCIGSSPVEVVSAPHFEYPLWRGESMGAIVRLEALRDVDGVNLKLQGAPGKANWVFEVMADVFGDEFNQCDDRPAGLFDSLMVVDRIGAEKTLDLKKGESATVWVGLKVPEDFKPASRKGVLKVSAPRAKTLKVPFTYEVLQRELPAPRDWAFHLDLWQNPYSVARYYGVELWSEEHFAKMRPIMEMLACAGQKVVTATILDRPWGGQTEDAFGPMVKKTRCADGSWKYDYSVFDKWVQFMESVGIDRQINCYSMIPWALSFDYFDEATSQNATVEAAVGSCVYREYWGSFIKDFAAHLREKGWFEKTAIAMDEREEEDMREALSVIRSAEPDMKVSLVGSFHASIADEIDDLCLGMRFEFPEGMVERRRAEGKTSTWYVCCSSKYPNTFLASDPLEASWMGWYTAAKGLDGMLRWAYNSWTVDPEKDARFRTWPAGDCYMVYPGGSSVRFERLREGIQDYEKIRILSCEWKKEGNVEMLSALENALLRFRSDSLAAEGPAPALVLGRSTIGGPASRNGFTNQ